MSQFDFGTITPATKSGTQLASDLNAWRTAVHSTPKGATQPSYRIAGMHWIDDTATPWIEKVYDGTDWISIGTIDATTNIFSVTAGPPTFTLVDAGAAVGPIVDAFRDSGSALAADIIAAYDFSGRSSTGVKRTYARMKATINDPTNASEDAGLQFEIMKAGTLSPTIGFGLTGPQIWGSANIATFNTDLDTNLFILQSGITGSTGAQVFLYGSTHSTNAHDIELKTAGTTRYFFDHSVAQHIFTGNEYHPGTLRIAQNTTDTPGSANNTVGFAFTSGGTFYLSSAGNSVHNRTTDGNLVAYGSGGTSQGLISVAGATVTYGAFFGSHWSQLIDGSKADIPRGTIVETIDQLCEWPAFKYTDYDGQVHTSEDVPDGLKLGDTFKVTYNRENIRDEIYEELVPVEHPKRGKPATKIVKRTRQVKEIVEDVAEATVFLPVEDRLACFKISDTEGTIRPYGVFAWWDDKDGGKTNDAFIGSLGAYVVRIAKGVVVAGGDLIESNGDGCGRVMDPDIEPWLSMNAIRVKQRHVATVTAAMPVPIHALGPLHYSDGSYLVPCTLHCG